VSAVDDAWREDAGAGCAAYGAALPSVPAPEAVSIAEYVAAWRELRDRLPWFGALDFPPELRTAPSDIPAVARQADRALAEAERAAAGDDVTAYDSVAVYTSLLQHAAALLTIAGAECGDPQRATNATLNVPVPGMHQVATGFGSVWTSSFNFGASINRVDANTGEVMATIDVGATPYKAQPADGRMIVRTANAYQAIDPATNTIVATLPKPDVGPAANRSWAVDGAMWICDGQRLHRYDPATFAPTGTTIELGIDCGQVYATTDLLVAWTYNEDTGESGTATAVFVDPASNQVLATTALPMDATVPIVLDDAVFFPANSFVPDNAGNAVVDRATWTITSTPDYGRTIGGSQMASDGQSIYLMADGKDVLVVDRDTYELTDVIEPLFIVDHINALAVGPGALWVATGDAGILQRFDRP
jgi:hypothetical protein